MSFLLAAMMYSCGDPVDTQGSGTYQNDPFGAQRTSQFVPEFKGNYTTAPPIPLFGNPPGFGPAPMGIPNPGARAATPPTIFTLRLVRQPDCSMTKYLTANDTDSGTFTVYSVPDVQTYLHTAAQLTTTPNQFKNGCNDNMTGKASEQFVNAGRTANGQLIGFQITADNALQEAVIDVSASTTTHAGTSTYTAYPSITYADSMVAVDLNGDGKQDIVVTDLGFNGGTPGVKVLLGHGDGTFAAPVNYPVSGLAGTVVVDDMNHDGKLDMMVAAEGQSSSTISFFPGNGDGTFGTPVNTTVSSYSGPIATGDFDGDGNKDIVTSQRTVLKGHGDGTFSTDVPISPSTPQQFGPPAVGDFNSDGKLDVAFSVNGGGGVYVFLGNGDGTFTLGRSYTSIYGSANISALDIDGDGNLDLVVGSGSSGALGPDQNTGGIWEVLMGNGDGTFQGSDLYPAVAQNERPNQFVFGDFNGDGSVDMLTDAVGSGLQFMANNSKGSFTRGAVNTSTQPVALAAALMNGDKNLDAVVLDLNAATMIYSVGVAFGNGDGTFQTVTKTPLPDQTGAYAVATGDFNGDGHPDVVVTTASTVYLYLNDGLGGLTAPLIVDTLPSSSTNYGANSALAVGDLNGDGKLDLVVSNEVTATVKVYPGNGNGTFGAATVYQPDTNSGAETGPVVLADINGDGKLDLVFATAEYSFSNPLLYVYPGKGDGTFGTAIATTLPQGTTGLAVADLNGDGKLDVLTGSCCGATYMGAVLGNGDGTFAGTYQFANALSVSPVGIADLNGDGQPDIVAGALEGGADGGIYVLLNLHGTSATQVATTTTLTATPNPATVGQSVTFTAIVTENGGSSVPTGTVTFFDGQTMLGKGTLTAGTTTFATSGLSAVSHAITASYGGDTGDATSVSAALTEVVNVPVVGTNTTLSAAPNPATVGQSVTFTAMVAAVSGTGVPSGTVTFMEGSMALGTGTLSAGSATFSTTALSVGTHTVTATYGGDSADSSSVSPAVAEVVHAAVAATATALSASVSSAEVGTSVTLTAKVTETAGSAVPTGTVTFMDGTATLGTGTLTAGTATLATMALTVGLHTLTATYGGDAGDAASVSAGVAVTITAAGTQNFAVALSPTSGTVGQFGTVSTTLTVTPAGGFNQPLTFACAGLPSRSICIFAPSVAMSNGGPVTAVMTIETGLGMAARAQPKGNRARGWTMVVAGMLGFGLLGLRRRGSNAMSGVLAALVLMAAGLAGCGAGSSAGGTPLGTSTVTVTATAGTATHTSTYTLTVR